MYNISYKWHLRQNKITIIFISWRNNCCQEKKIRMWQLKSLSNENVQWLLLRNFITHIPFTFPNKQQTAFRMCCKTIRELFSFVLICLNPVEFSDKHSSSLSVISIIQYNISAGFLVKNKPKKQKGKENKLIFVRFRWTNYVL